ncbi:MAG: hypothetical protein JJD92_02260 [Frankiaceae bacterium]|nr:hypothetical protein [Frankiaceae bacterium]
MTDPRELGLPPFGVAPSFAPSRNAMESACRRHQHRRRTRTAFTGVAAAAFAAAVIAAQLGQGSTSVLEQDQPAVRPTPQVTAVPSAVTDALAVPPTALDLPSGDRMPRRSAATAMSAPTNPLPHHDATQWKRVDVGAGWSCSTTAISEWTATGWCLDATLPNNIRTGHRTRLDVRVCRTGVDARELRFPTRQQAAVQFVDTKHHRVLWSSAERPSPFAAGERVLVLPGRCVQWTTVWNVRSAGQRIAPGTYQYQWTTGTGLTTPTGTGDHQLQAVKVVAR